ncbi:acyltransferase family protein [Mongoliimonas terrestris]|uniref:acyltransferase family protein n=1 Tax=Mongoliimonas terrestris TaxID=1709001 RepID=UPI0009498E94|nr:acyltransferase family protein [Mongoliimonas terrestris]
MHITTDRLLWPDVAKGFGIILVVIGHVSDSLRDWIFLFHMPLFFVLSGYLFKPSSTYEFRRKKTTSLVLPYVSFLVTLFCLTKLSQLSLGHVPSFYDLLIDVAKMIYGGAALKGVFGVFWFVSCLFIAMLLYNRIVNRYKSPYSVQSIGTIFVCLLMGYALSYTIAGIVSPFNISAVPMAVVIIWFGHMMREFDRKRSLLLFLSGAVILLCIALYRLGVDFSVDMKYLDFGPPLFGIALALAISVIYIEICRRFEKIPTIAAPVASVGEASLVIMFFHQFIHYTLRDYGWNSDFVIILTGILVPYLMFRSFRNVPILAFVYLGRPMSMTGKPDFTFR